MPITNSTTSGGGGSWTGWEKSSAEQRRSEGERRNAERRAQRRQPGNSKPQRSTPQPTSPSPSPSPQLTPTSRPKTVNSAPWENRSGKLPKNAASNVPYTSPPPQRAPGNNSDLHNNLTKQPRRAPNPTTAPDTKTATTKTPKQVNPSRGGAMVGPGMAGFGQALPDLMRGDFGRAGASFAGGYLGAAAATAAVGLAAAAAGVSAPAWAPAGALLAGSYFGAAAAQHLWDKAFGDGTEGTQQPAQAFQPGSGGPGQVPGAIYLVQGQVGGPRHDSWYGSFLSETYGLFTRNVGPGPVTLNVVVDNKPFHQPGSSITIFINGNPFYSTGDQFHHTEFRHTLKLVREDGTSEALDIMQGLGYKPELPQINVTNNTIQNGDTIFNFGAMPPAGGTPVLPPPVAPPTPAKPTAATATATPSAAPSPTPQLAPSPNPQPAPPLTANPSAPTTGAGTPTPQAPTTGPRPSPGSASTAGGGTTTAPNSGSGTATLIAGVSPAIAGLITATNNALNPQPQTPTGTPVVVPGTDTATGPNNQPVNQTQPSVIPGTTTTPGTTSTPGQNTVGNQITQSNQQQQNSQQQLIDQLTNPTGQGTTNTTVPTPSQADQISNTVNQNTTNLITNQTTTITQNIDQSTTTITQNIDNSTTNLTQNIDQSTTNITNQIVELSEQADVDIASLLAILGTLATATALSNSTQTITTAIAGIPAPTPCAYPAYHPTNQAERAAISGKVDTTNTVLGTVTNVQVAAARNDIANVAGLIGTPVAGGAQTVLGGINTVQTFLGKFARSLRLDKIYNGLTLLVSLHNAAMLSKNLAETVGYFLDSGLQALNLKNENEDPLDLGEAFSSTIANFIKGIVGEEVFNGLSANWKKASAIYTSAINVLDNVTAMLAGLAESMEIIGNYTGKIGNALKKGGVVLENAYNWMDDNLRLKTGRFAGIQKVVDGINNAEDVVNNLTEVTDSINESEELVNEIKQEWTDIKGRVTEGEGQKLTAETQNKVASQGSPVSKPDLITPED